MICTQLTNLTGATRLYRQMSASTAFLGWSDAPVGDGSAKRNIPVAHATTRRPQEASH